VDPIGSLRTDLTALLFLRPGWRRSTRVHAAGLIFPSASLGFQILGGFIHILVALAVIALVIALLKKVWLLSRHLGFFIAASFGELPAR